MGNKPFKRLKESEEGLICKEGDIKIERRKAKRDGRTIKK